MPTTYVMTTDAFDDAGTGAAPGDTADYSGSTGFVSLDWTGLINSTNSNDNEGTFALNDYFAYIDHFILTAYDDTFVAPADNREVWVWGGSGNDRFFAGNGTFHFVGGVVSPGSLALTSTTQGNQLNFSRRDLNGTGVTASTDGSIVGGAASGSSWSDIHTLEGTRYGDYLYSSAGDGVSHILSGDSSVGTANPCFSGDDHLFGAETLTGADIGVIGLTDTYIPGFGSDTIYLGARINHVDYENAFDPITVDILNSTSNTGMAAGDQYKYRDPSTGLWINVDSNYLRGIHLTGGMGSDVLWGTNQDDVISGGGPDATYQANSYADSGDDVIHGRGGSDHILGLAGNDTLYGDEGDDWLEGRSGTDTLYGGDGNDLLVGGTGADSLWGGAGTDTFRFTTYGESNAAAYDIIQDFGAGDRIDIGNLTGVSSVSIVVSGTGRFLFASDGTSTLQVGSVNGMQGSDLMLPHSVSSIYMLGGSGDDILVGATTNDVMQGGAGADWLNGGGGADAFVYTSAADSTLAAPDVIFDFASGVDHISLAGMGLSTSNVGWMVSGNDTYVFVDTNNDSVGDMAILLNGVTNVGWGDFLFS